MPATDKLFVLPSRGAQVQIKQKMVAARKGLNLLKRKRDALEIKLREITEELSFRKGALEDLMRSAYLALAKAKFLGFDHHAVIASTCEHAEVMLRIKYRNVAGVKLPHFEIIQSGNETYPLSGLARGGQQVLNIRRDFQEVLLYLSELASLQYAAKVIRKCVVENNIRVNGLEHVLIPKFENTLRFIAEELDELEREDFYRIKMSKSKQKRPSEVISK